MKIINTTSIQKIEKGKKRKDLEQDFYIFVPLVEKDKR